MKLFPVILLNIGSFSSLFKKGSTDPVQYRGERTIVGLVEAVNELAGTFRRSDGSFDDGLGTFSSHESYYCSSVALLLKCIVSRHC